MKHSKWLLILVLILLFINSLFFIIWYSFDVQQNVQNKISIYISEELGGDLSIGKMTINERFVSISDVYFRDRNNSISMQIDKIQIRYNLLNLIISGFKFKRIIQQVSVFSPSVVVNYEYLKPVEYKEPFRIPDFTDYFKSIIIQNGYINFYLTTTLSNGSTIVIKEDFVDFNSVIINGGTTSANLNAMTANDGQIKARITLDKGLLTQISIDIEKLRPKKISYTSIDNFKTELTGQFRYIKKKHSDRALFNIKTQLNGTELSYNKYNLSVPLINIVGNHNDLQYDAKDINFNHNKLSINGNLTNYLSDNIVVDNKIDINRISISDFIVGVDAQINGQAMLYKDEDNLIIKTDLFTPVLTAYEEKVHDVGITAAFADNKLSFVAQNFVWRDQISKLEGIYDFEQEQLNFHLSTNPQNEIQNIKLWSDISALLKLNKDNLSLDAKINNLGIETDDFKFVGLQGNLYFEKSARTLGRLESSLSISDDKYIDLFVVGDPEQMMFQSELTFDNANIKNYLVGKKYHNLDSGINGVLRTTLTNNIISGNTNLNFDVNKPYPINGSIISDFSYNILNKSGSINMISDSATANLIPFKIDLTAQIDSSLVKVVKLKLDDITALGAINIDNIYDSSIKIQCKNFEIDKYWRLLNLQKKSPISAIFDLVLDYNLYKNNVVSGFIKTDSIVFPPLKEISLDVDINGKIDSINVNAIIDNKSNKQINLKSLVKIGPESEVTISSDLQNLFISDFFELDDINGKFDGKTYYKLIYSPNSATFHEIASQLHIKELNIYGTKIDSAYIDITQHNNYLEVDTLYAIVGNLLRLKASGELDYNFITDDFFPGEKQVNISFEGDILRWLRNQIPYIENSRGRMKSAFTISTEENGINIINGKITLVNGMLKLKNQLETISDINIEASINNNQLLIDKFTTQIGQGKLYIRNEIDAGDDNFFIGPINMGFLMLKTDDSGIQVNIPDYLPANTVATAVLKGKNSMEATIKGPFDDMEVSGEIIASNGSVIYPAKTKNLLQLLNVFQKKTDTANPPLPFTLDLLIKVSDNISYITYPANLICKSGSYLRLTYDGLDWDAEEAELISEKGTLDFYGTIFDVDNVKVDINASREIVAVNGIFTKKTFDGTLVTLTVTTNQLKGEHIFNQLEFILSSDNPDDKSTTQVLSRLRYDRNIDELTSEQKQSLLSDEAMQLISASVSSTYVSQFLSPVEHRIRRFLKLDSFSIKTGFVQNLFVEFGTGNQDKASFSNAESLNSDILEFSSSIFLNNLSVSMGKYMGRKLFMDYEVNLQKTTDLDKETKIELYHNVSLRYSLPWKLRFIYTFTLKPKLESNTHEVMFQRSFNF